MLYAEIDSDNRCYCVSDFGSATPPSKPTLIPTDDTSCIGKIWNAETEEWEEPDPEPTPTPTPVPTTTDELADNQLAIMEALADLYEAIAPTEE